MPSKFRAIIVDDERLARQDLKAIIDEFDEIECVGEAKNITTAKELLKKFNPNLLFLDIKMPGETGFDLLDFIEKMSSGESATAKTDAHVDYNAYGQGKEQGSKIQIRSGIESDHEAKNAGKLLTGDIVK